MNLQPLTPLHDQETKTKKPMQLLKQCSVSLLENSLQSFLKSKYQFQTISRIKPLSCYDEFAVEIVGDIRISNAGFTSKGDVKRYVLKISEFSIEKVAQLQLEVEVMFQLNQKDSQHFKVPEIIVSADDKMLEAMQLSSLRSGFSHEKGYVCRLMSFIEGQNLASISKQGFNCLLKPSKSLPLIEKVNSFEHEFGRVVSSVHLAMQELYQELNQKHQTSQSDYLKLSNTHSIRNLEKFVDLQPKLEMTKQNYDIRLYRLMLTIIEFFKRKNVFETLANYERRTLIHNDLGGENVILMDCCGRKQFGLIDFSDVMMTFQVSDLAVAIGRFSGRQSFDYSLSSYEQSISSIARILSGYQEKRKLSATEKEFILLLAYARLVTSCVMSKFQTYVVQSGKCPNSYVQLGFQQASSNLLTLCSQSLIKFENDSLSTHINEFQTFFTKQSEELWKKVESFSVNGRQLKMKRQESSNRV